MNTYYSVSDRDARPLNRPLRQRYFHDTAAHVVKVIVVFEMIYHKIYSRKFYGLEINVTNICYNTFSKLHTNSMCIYMRLIFQSK